MNSSLLVALAVGSVSVSPGKISALSFRSNQHHRYQPSSRCHHHHLRPETCLYVVRRPHRPASTEKKRAERKAIIQSRQNEALQDPTLLTNLSFSECKELHPGSKRALVEDMGLRTMTEVQAKAFSSALSGKDILARARTGTGKTLAFLVPSVERILSNPTYVPGRSISCLVIAPTRELAIQIGDETEKMLAHHSDLSVQVMYGGTKMARDMNALNKLLPTILIATPGRLLDHLQSTKVRGRKFNDDIMANIDILVLDEIDRLLESRREIQKILSFLPRKEKRQTMMFSATIPKGLKGIMQESMRDDYFEVDCVSNDGMMAAPTNLRVTQSHVIMPTLESAIPSIYSILKQSTTERLSKVVVFFPTARMVSFFADFFRDGFDCPIIELHSKKSQSSRNTASEQFRRLKNALLFTSDVSARGIDFPDVTQVVQFGLPESRNQYIHRLGRTARAGKEGTGLLVLFPFESKFLLELGGLDVPREEALVELLQRTSELHEEPEWMAHNIARIRSGGNKLSTSAQMAYLAFLGYYLGQASRVSSNKADVVKLANDFSKAIGLAKTPALPPKLVSKLDLNGIPGIVSENEVF
ncbi:hypothetical protein ACHAWF_008355 [Thalassiosira exigua]